MEVVKDRLSLSLDDGVDDSLDCPHGGVVTLLLPIVGGITNLQFNRDIEYSRSRSQSQYNEVVYQLTRKL